MGYQSWLLYKNVMGIAFGISDEGDTRRFPTMNITCLVERRPNFVLWNVALPAFIISLINFAPFGLASTKYDHTRLSLAMGLTLTIVSLKASAHAKLPAIAYSTLIDQYVLLFAIAARFADDEALAEALTDDERSWIDADFMNIG